MHAAMRDTRLMLLARGEDTGKGSVLGDSQGSDLDIRQKGP